MKITAHKIIITTQQHIKYHQRELNQTTNYIISKIAHCGASEAGQEIPSNSSTHEVRCEAKLGVSNKISGNIKFS